MLSTVKPVTASSKVMVTVTSLSLLVVITTSNDRLVTVTITFDEAVTGFTVDNIDFSNANVTPYGSNGIGTLNRSADGRTYTITYTAGPDVEDATNTIS